MKIRLKVGSGGDIFVVVVCILLFFFSSQNEGKIIKVFDYETIKVITSIC